MMLLRSVDLRCRLNLSLRRDSSCWIISFIISLIASTLFCPRPCLIISTASWVLFSFTRWIFAWCKSVNSFAILVSFKILVCWSSLSRVKTCSSVSAFSNIGRVFLKWFRWRSWEVIINPLEDVPSSFNSVSTYWILEITERVWVTQPTLFWLSPMLL